MYKNKALSIFLFAFLSLFSVYASAQVMRIGVSAAYEPFEFRDAKKQIVGFDIDLAKAICQELKWSCVFSDHAFDTLMTKLEKKQIDLIISAFDITEEAKQRVKFSDAYFHSGGYFIASKGKFKTALDLQNKKVGVLKGRLHAAYLNKNFSGINIKENNHIPTILKELKNKQLDAVFIDDSIGDDFLKKNADFETVGELVQDKGYFSGGFGIAARQDDNANISKVNTALKTINQSGGYQAIYDKWFSDQDWLSINNK